MHLLSCISLLNSVLLIKSDGLADMITLCAIINYFVLLNIRDVSTCRPAQLDRSRFQLMYIICRVVRSRKIGA